MKGARQPVSSTRGWLFIALRWAAALLVLAVLFHFLPFATLRTAIARIPPARFLIILFLYLCAHCVGVLKWRMVVNAAGASLDLATSAQCYFGGLFGTLFLPSIVGGDAIRLAVGLQNSPRPAAVLAGNLADRLLDVAAQATLVTIGLSLLPGSLPLAWRERAIHYLLLLVAAGLAGLALLYAICRVVVKRSSWKLRRLIVRLRFALRSVKRRPVVLIAGWLTGTLIQFTFLVLTALLAISCGLTLPLRVWLFAWPLAKLAAVLPLTQGGIGVREAALVALLSPFGAPGALVLAAGLVWEGIVIFGGLIAGLFALILRQFSSSEKTS
ncbi:MAG: flippase-like domain-containing protein [Acidobacteria bacterium]|nr:flippase-like domain-containing protein [Acidobacteriota bacterium]MBS1864406.1 flippase-like domain-containing protein [Acidobacteriota bacterium]